MGPIYEPKSLKVRFDTKNAFITMLTQKDAEEFIKKIQDPSKKSLMSEIFFSLYKSKIERISSNSNFKRYNEPNMNNYSKNSAMGSSNFKSFNSKNI